MSESDIRPVPVTYGPSTVDYYFPKEYWLPQIFGREFQMDGATMTHVPINHILQFASCVRCGACVEQSHWNNHINWHTNSLEA